MGYTLSFLYNNLLLFFLLVYCREMPLSFQSSDGFSSLIFRQKMSKVIENILWQYDMVQIQHKNSTLAGLPAS